jgi:hypothetical protein
MKELNFYWEKKVQTFYRNHFQFLKEFISLLMVPLQDSSEEEQLSSHLSIINEKWQDVAAIYHQLITIYFDLQILHIRHSNYLQELRELIWILSVLPFFYYRLQYREQFLLLSANSRGNSQKEEKSSSPAFCSWEEFMKVKSYGSSLLQKNGSKHSSPQRILLEAVNTELNEISSIHSSLSSKCLFGNFQSQEELVAALGAVRQFNELITIEHCSFFAVVHCISRPQSLFSKSWNQGSAVTVVAVEDPSTVLYCWCRGIDDGLPMICCDSCEEWFHHSCVNIPVQPNKNKRKRKETKTESAPALIDLSPSVEPAVSVVHQSADINLTRKESQNDQFFCLSCRLFSHS